MNLTNQHEQAVESLGKLVLRLTIGGLMLFHGFAKLQNGVGPIEGMLQSNGLPAAMAYGVYIGEVLVPLAMMLGILTRIASVVFVFNMVMAIGLAHAGDILSLNEFGGWAIELQMLYLLGALSLFFLGAGRYSAWRGQNFWTG